MKMNIFYIVSLHNQKNQETSNLLSFNQFNLLTIMFTCQAKCTISIIYLNNCLLRYIIYTLHLTFFKAVKFIGKTIYGRMKLVKLVDNILL